MTAADAYSEAQRRIHAAKSTGQHWLDLGDIEGLAQIPDDIGELTALRELSLDFLGYDLDAGEWVYKDYRWFSRPLSDLGPLARLTLLERLFVRNAKVSDLSPLTVLSGLLQLHVSDTLVSDLSPLASLSTMQLLIVDGQEFSDLSPLSGLNALRSLMVSGRSVSDLSSLASLSALKSLSVMNSSVTDLSPLASLGSLQTLDVSETPVRDLSPLARLRSLQTLDVSDTSVDDLSPLADLRSLQTLDLSGTSVSDLSLLARLRSLEMLCISGTSVSDLSPLSGLSALRSLMVSYTSVSDLSPLAGLRSLQTLHVGGTLVSDLSPLAGLSALRSLMVSDTAVSDLSSLTGLRALQTLYVSECQGMGSWQALRGHESLRELQAFGSAPAVPTPDLLESLPALKKLTINRILGAPPEVLSENQYSDCLPEFRSWVADLQAGEDRDQEVKVFVLGNGTAGKTQICRQLRGEGYDDQVPSTHGVQIGHFPLLPDAGQGATRAKLWDFGGQDIYHGTHALFLEGRAVFILVWSREVEAAGDYDESGLSMHHHRLTYWLDYVRSLAGEDAALIVVQAKCDRESDRAAASLPAELDFKWPPPQVTCSAKMGEMGELNAAISSATRYLLETHGTYRLPASWVAVRDKLRELKLTEKTVSRERFDELCRETHGTSVPAALLSYLHRRGEVFYRKGLFKDEIVLDQEWAVRAIYAVLDRNGPCQVLRQVGGVFTLPMINHLVWHDEFSEKERETILSMMASCAICFPLDEHSHTTMQRYALPDLLPLEADVKWRVEALWRPELPAEQVTLEYAFLHAGILRQFLCQIGKLGGPDAAYWRYGCCFYDGTTHGRARIRAESTGTPEAPARGRIVMETCDGNARELLARLLKAIMEIRIGQPPQVIEAAGAGPRVTAEEEEPKPLAEVLKIAPAPTKKPLIYLSYAWGGAKEELVDHLEARLTREGYDVKRDKRAMRPGDWISDFMREIGQAKRVCVVLSEKYVQSRYCMRELLYLYQSSCGEKADFLNRIVPLVLEDAKLSKTPERLAHVRYWNAQLQELKDATAGLDPATWGGAGADMTMIQDFCHHTELMLRHVSDHLMPRGIKNIEKDNFAEVIAALKAKG